MNVLDENRPLLPLLRGATDGANCEECPFSINGMPKKPVVGEGPDVPLWIVVGEGPGYNEVRFSRPFIGASGQVVNKLLAKIGRPRDQLWVTNATLCVEGTTQVRLADGSLERIDSLVARQYDGLVKSVTSDGQIVDRRVTNWFRNPRGRREMVDVAYRWAQNAGGRGRTHAVVTEDHQILTRDGWLAARDVAGGLIATGDREPDPISRSIAFGTLLGDGTLQRGSLIVRHAEDQAEYVGFKRASLWGLGANYVAQNARGSAQAQVGFRTQAGAWGHATRALFYPNGTKRIPRQVMERADDLLFAIWFLDDGYMQHRPPRSPSAEICAVGFPEDDLRLASARLRELGLETVIRRGRIRFNVDSTAKFSARIARFVPPSMQYKLRPEDRGQFDPDTFASREAQPFYDYAETKVVSPRRKGEGSTVYCLEVEETHNFVAAGAVLHNCQPFDKATDVDKGKAAACCKPRLTAELAQFPGLPVLTLGAIAARSLIPKESLDAIEPPDAPKIVRKAQKLRQQPQLKTELARRRAVTKETERQLKRLIKYEKNRLRKEVKRRYKRKADDGYLQAEINRVLARLELKAREHAINAISFKIKERAVKAQIRATQPRKKHKSKLVKITDIAGTLFDVDVDGSGVRPLVPGIHPAALLRGGSGSIGGSHSPDMAYINLIYDASKIDSLARGKDIRLKLNIEYELEDADRAVRLFMQTYRDALDEGACSLDLETYVDDPDRHTALQAFIAKIRVIGLATKKGTISLAWDLLPPLCQSLLQVLITSVEMTYHNGLYDRTVLMSYGFIMTQWDRWFCTLLAHHAAFPGNSHKLQIVGSQFYGLSPWKSEWRNSDGEDLEKLAVYNAKDTGVTHALRAPLTLWMKRKNTERVYDLDKKMSAMASRMHLAGMPVDRGINDELLATFSKGVADSRRAVEDIARDPKLREQIWHHLAIQQAGKARKTDPKDYEDRYNVRLSAMKLDPDWKWKIGAGKHIAALLLAMGVSLTQRTDGGEISTKKDVLEALVDVPIVRDILSYRENDKLLSTFVFGVFDRYDRNGELISYGYADDNDRIRPIWNIHRISGRWASQWPVVSNVPKDKWKKVVPQIAETIIARQAGDVAEAIVKAIANNKSYQFTHTGSVYRVNKDATLSIMTRPNLRRQIHARPGRIFVGFDFAQIEARVIALISGDPFLCAIFAEGRDPHIECARIVWPNFDSLDPDTRKGLRENIKNVEYGFLYMAQLETLYQTMLKAGNLIKKSDLAVAISKLAKAMAGIPAWHRSTIATAVTPPFEIKDFILGRFRCWPMGQAEGPEAVNYGVQTAAAAIMNTGMARFAERIDDHKEVDPIGQFHDAAVFECWEDEAEAVAKDVKESFEQRYERDGRSIPFPIDVKIAPSWDKV